jgi:hypothetical protein
MVKRLAIRLGAPMFPGSKLTYTGSVTARTEPGLVEVTFRATNDLGDHVSGAATVDLPVGR